MAYTKTTLTPDPTFLQAETYDARSLRKFLASIVSEGVEESDDFAVTIASGLQLAIAPGVAYVLGGNVADQGMYRQYISAAVNITVGAHHATLPRLDQIILRVMDNTHDAAGANEGRIEVVPGTATAGATLVNRNGAHTLVGLDEASSSWILLADVLVPATSGALTIGDRRLAAGIGGGLAAGVPVGVALPWLGDGSTPWGFLLGDNVATFSRTQYARLFAIVGTKYGAGDGSTTFGLDLAGRMLVGKGTHADVNALTDNDGLSVANRTPKISVTNITADAPGATGGVGAQTVTPGYAVCNWIIRY